MKETKEFRLSLHLTPPYFGEDEIHQFQDFLRENLTNWELTKYEGIPAEENRRVINAKFVFTRKG